MREIGAALTRDLILTCRPFSAADALGAGFLNQVGPAAEVMATAEELANSLVAALSDPESKERSAEYLSRVRADRQSGRHGIQHLGSDEGGELRRDDGATTSFRSPAAS